MDNDTQPMPSTKIAWATYEVIGTTHSVITKMINGAWYLIVNGDQEPMPFRTKRASLQYCQEHAEL